MIVPRARCIGLVSTLLNPALPVAIAFIVTEIRRQIYWLRCDEISNEIFRTSNIDIINDCGSNFSFMLRSKTIEIRKAKFEGKF